MRSTRDDLRDAARPDARRNRERLTTFSVLAWRWVFFVVAVLALGGLAELLR